jgi:hypothetical protein
MALAFYSRPFAVPRLHIPYAKRRSKEPPVAGFRAGCKLLLLRTLAMTEIVRSATLRKSRDETGASAPSGGRRYKTTAMQAAHRWCNAHPARRRFVRAAGDASVDAGLRAAPGCTAASAAVTGRLCPAVLSSATRSACGTCLRTCKRGIIGKLRDACWDV